MEEEELEVAAVLSCKEEDYSCNNRVDVMERFTGATSLSILGMFSESNTLGGSMIQGNYSLYFLRMARAGTR